MLCCYIIIIWNFNEVERFSSKMCKTISYGKHEQTRSVTVEEIEHVAKVLFLPSIEWTDFRLSFKACKNFPSLVYWPSIKKNGILLNPFPEAYMKEAINSLKINHTYYIFPLLKLLSYMYIFSIWTKSLHNIHYYLKYRKIALKC